MPSNKRVRKTYNPYKAAQRQRAQSRANYEAYIEAHPLEEDEDYLNSWTRTPEQDKRLEQLKDEYYKGMWAVDLDTSESKSAEYTYLMFGDDWEGGLITPEYFDRLLESL